MDIVTIDFETYYTREYSLSKLTTEEYIRSDDFEVVGVGVKVNNNPADWYSGGDVRTFLNSLDYSDKAILCHNAPFDGAILAWHFGIKPKFWFDTLSMARPKHQVTVGGSLRNLVLYFKLGEKGTEVLDAIGKRRKDFSPAQLKTYGNYCLNDVDLTYKLFLKLKKDFPVSELMVIDQTVRMYTEPTIELDRFKLQDHLTTELERKQKLLNKLGNGDPEGARKVLASNPKFASLLESFGVPVPMKTSLRTGKETYAFAKTDQGLLDLLEHENPAVRAVTEARIGTKSTIEETRTQRLIDVSKRGPLPILLNYYGAHTGRFSGGDKLNLQNLPSRQGNAIRTTLCAPEGHKLIACDSSQIEARMLAYIAGQHDLVEAFREGRDVYSEFAAAVYGISPDVVSDEQRFLGKTCILGLGYGMGAEKFKDTLRRGSPSMRGANTPNYVDEAEATRIVRLYRKTYPAIPRLWDAAGSALNVMDRGRSGVIGAFIPYDADGIKLPNGMYIRYTALQPAHEANDGLVYISDARTYRKLVACKVTGSATDELSWTKIYGGKVVENIIQALARIVITEQMTEIGHQHKVVFQVHDEIIVSAGSEEAEAVQQDMERVMSIPPSWAEDLPIACKSRIGDNYGECK